MRRVRPGLFLGIFALLLAAVFAAASGRAADAGKPAGAGETAAAEPSAYGKTVVIPITGVILFDDWKVKALVGAENYTFDKDVVDAIEKAEKDGARGIVLEIDSPGGVVDSCEKISSALIHTSLPTVALVTKQAISGGSMVATACREIVMVKGTTLGDCEPHIINGELPGYMREKIETVIRARMRANAQENGYPGKVLEAMVTKAIELYRVEFSDGTSEYLKKEELDLLEKQIESKEVKRTITNRALVVGGDRLLTLTAQEAVEHGVAKEVADSVGAFYAARDIPPSERYLAAPKKAGAGPSGLGAMSFQYTMLLVLCIVIGIAGVVVEVNVPGFGLPGIIGIIGFSCFFVLLFMHDRASPWEVGLFVLGVSLVLVELFVLPGFGVCGITGILAIVAALTLSYLPPFDSGLWRENWKIELSDLLGLFGLASVLSLAAAALLVRFLPRIPVLSAVVLGRTLRSGAETLADVEQAEAGRHPHEIRHTERELKGVRGVAATVLRPAGKMRTDDGRTLDVVSDGGLISEGTRVRIAEVNGPRITVVREG